MIEQLSAPKVIQTPFGNKTYTHCAWSFHASSSNVESICTYGVLDGGGNLIPDISETFVIQGDDFTSLTAANVQGKKAGEFRNDDVRATHLTIRSRVGGV